MSWKETSLGSFERPLNSVEMFFKTLGDGGRPLSREHWAVRICAEFRLDPALSDISSVLRRAWIAMRYDHPQIASFARGQTRVYEVPDSAALDSWVAETFMVSPGTTAEELIASFRPSSFPIIHYLPDTSEILIRLSHWYADATGATCLMSNFFKALSEPRTVSFGDEWKNLSPGLEEAAGFNTVPTDVENEMALQLLMEYAGNLPSIGLPIVLPNQLPGSTQRCEIILPQKTTSAIVEACRKQDATVTMAIHSALIEATQSLAPSEHGARNYTSWGTFSFRPYLQPEYSEAKIHPVNVYLCGLPLTLIPSSFSDNILLLKPFYKQLSMPSVNAKFRNILRPFNQKAAAMLSQPSSNGMPEPTEPVLSSIGAIDSYLDRRYGNKVELTRFWLSSEVLSRQPLIHAWTWQGKLSLSVCYNEEFYNAVYMNNFLEVVRGLLLKGLKIGS